ncbi:hypothetical protein EVAR_66537_1 [Eumeta japonica]|uniref:Uncharacterized protein n=1 Tax=Eumeta variegata TaxID=151549 RepID=A0A4C1ZBR8_EUMVA|nr:hypothetical protein EVAR_66537_1 [Eumeta japonica]
MSVIRENRLPIRYLGARLYFRLLSRCVRQHWGFFRVHCSPWRGNKAPMGLLIRRPCQLRRTSGRRTTAADVTRRLSPPGHRAVYSVTTHSAFLIAFGIDCN